MRELLKSNERRRTDLIELLLNSNEWITLQSIANELDCSTRILKEDVNFFREAGTNIQIESSQQGIRLQLDYKSNIKDYYRQLLEETLSFQILEQIFFDDTLSIEDLSEILHASPSTIYRSINHINEYFSPHHSLVETNPCKLVGDELFIRNYYCAYFKETSTVLEWPFKDRSEAEINQRFDKVLALLPSDMPIDFSFYESIKLVVMVNSYRYNQGYLIETGQHQGGLMNIILNVVSFVSSPLQRLSGKRSPEFYHQVYHPYIHLGDNIYNKKKMMEMRRQNNEMDQAMTFMESFLEELSHQLDVPVNIEELLFSLTGTTSIEEVDPNSKYILFNRYKYFVQILNQETPWLYQKFYAAIVEFRLLLKKDLDEDKINKLIYTLFTFWENLLPNLYKKHRQVSILILSDEHFSHAEMLRNSLLFELGEIAKIEVYKGQKISKEILEKMQHDLIISTFNLPELVNTETYIINHFPTYLDSVSIKKIIDKITKAKKPQFTTVHSQELIHSL